jgi:hypothetical protein
MPAHPVIFGHGVFAAQKPQELVTADILSAIHAEFRLSRAWSFAKRNSEKPKIRRIFGSTSCRHFVSA